MRKVRIWGVSRETRNQIVAKKKLKTATKASNIKYPFSYQRNPYLKKKVEQQYPNKKNSQRCVIVPLV